MNMRTIKMAQGVKALGAKPKGPELNHRDHMVEGENFLELPSDATPGLCCVHEHRECIHKGE